MSRLHELLAVYGNGKMVRINAEINAIFHGKTQQSKAALFQGSVTKFTPLSENDKETTTTVLPIVNLVSASERAKDLWADLADMKLSIETGNMSAKAPLRDESGAAVSEEYPAIWLLPFRQILLNVKTYISELVTLDPAVKWTWNEQLGLYESEVTRKERTKKIREPMTLAPATDKHPAQVQVFDVDKVIGHTDEVRYSTAIPAVRKVEMLDAIDTLIDRVTRALEEANRVEVKNLKATDGLLTPIFDLMKKPA